MKNIFILFLTLLSSNVFGQLVVTEFNADWNSANKVEWLEELSDCDIAKVDIVKEPTLQKNHKVVIVPTIIIFKDGDEVARFQADISFKMLATREDVQNSVDELLMSDF